MEWYKPIDIIGHGDVEDFLKTLPDQFDLLSVQQDLAKYGYLINLDGKLSEQTTQVITAFQMHFRPSNYEGKLDRETVALLKKYAP